MSRIMSIDYGKRRTGLAVTDPLQLIACGLGTIETSQLMDYLKSYLAKENVERFVVGLPIQSNGVPSENAARTKACANKLKKTFGIPVDFYDERFTSVLAHKTILASGIGKKKRQEKALVDKISATIILESYMESRKRKTDLTI